MAADAVSEFYKGQQIDIVVGHQVGTCFDIYSRVLQRHLGKHIPGQPAIVVKNMVGAGGIATANWIANLAPKDGTAMGITTYAMLFEPLFGNAKAKYDPMKFHWIGNVDRSVTICGVTKTAGISTFDQLRTTEALFGAGGATGGLGRQANAVKRLTGAKLRVVYGYKGSAAIKLAANRGEVAGICGLPFSTVKSSWGAEYRSGAFKPIIQLSGLPHAELRDIPHVNRYAETVEDQEVFNLVFGAQALGRFYFVPPEVPSARVNALRAAFTATMKDEAFVADAEKAKIDIAPMTGEEVESLVKKYLSASPTVVGRAMAATSRD